MRMKITYNVSGYRYAPESFHAYKGLAGHPRQELPLTHEQRQNAGCLCITKGSKEALDYVKRIDRQLQRKSRCYMTYGFMLQDGQRRFAYCPGLFCRPDAPLLERLSVLRMVREQFEMRNGQIEESAECELDGQYRPTNIRKNYSTVDLSRPVVVWLRSA